MILEVEDLVHRYGDERAVDGVSFGVDAGEVVALLGPSGCGKTTIVQAIAGHVRPTGGRISLRGEDVTRDPPESRCVSVVFQRSTLYPHMTVGRNVAYGLRPRGIDRREEVVARYLELVGLEDRRGEHPASLSGGQRRRVELARALAPDPDVLVLDEPLASLDRALRERLREEIGRIQRETGVATLFVTHDQEEAMAVADRLVVMNDGAVSAVGRPRDLYESPPTRFVASFLGRSNALSARVVDASPPTIALGDDEFVLTGPPLEPAADRATCHVRPDAVAVGAERGDAALALDGTVRRVSDVGSRYDVAVELDAGDEVVVERTADPPTAGDRVAVGLDLEDVTVYAEDAPRAIASRRENARL